MRIAFVGLGQMGKHMAMNMLKSEAEVIVNDMRTDSFPELESKGARTTTNIMDVVDCDIIFLCLPNSAVVESVVLGKNGIIHNLREGQKVIDFSTIKYSSTVALAKALEAKGVGFLDAPISGMEARAKDGTLTIMCGGNKELYEETMPYFRCVGSKILYMGPTGSGQLTKLINQLLYDINVAALAEILPMSVKMGLDPVKVGEVVNSGTGRSYASEFFIQRILKDRFSDGYSLQNAYKDLVSAAEISANLCIPMPVLSAATVTYQTALLQGHGAEDKGSMIKVFEDLLGVHYRDEQ